MLQFYFLSILFTMFTGFILVNDTKNIIELPVLKERMFRLVLGVVCCLTGVVKLFVVVKSSAVIVADLIPALAGVAGGICLMLQDTNERFPEWFNKIFVTNKLIVGFVCLGAALLHFVFPGALFL